MPKLIGIFSNYKELEKLNAEDLNHWLKAKEDPSYLENYIGNRILYPQAVPLGLRELEIDLAILREYLRIYPGIVYNPKTKKMLIQEELEVRFPPLQKLVGAILDIISLEGTTPVIIHRLNGVAEVVGTIISPTPAKEGFTDVNIIGQVLKLETDSVTILPNQQQNVVVKVGQMPAVSIAGGSLGIVIDLRKVAL